MLLRILKNYYHLLEALIAGVIFGFPARRLTIIGITGTDGKTTTTSIIFHLLKSAGLKAGMISTVGAKINDKDYSIGLHTTTPSAFLIQGLLKKMVDQKCKYAVLEVTSHAVNQNRIAFCPFYISVLTNITRDHLDYHGSVENYFMTKLQFLKKSRISVINRDDLVFAKIKPLLNNKVISYGLGSDCDIKALEVGQSENYQKCRIKGEIDNIGIDFPVAIPLLGNFNLHNALAAVTACLLLKISPEAIKIGLATLPGVKGRMEIIQTVPFRIIIDFAHTPNAFHEVLTTVKQLSGGKIIHVFGATGKRDTSKRQLMGEISGKLADICILTSEDTYGEDPVGIIRQIERGIKITSKKINETYYLIPDRKTAIKKALEIAANNDTVLITGVGHQTTLNIGKKEIPWNDSEAVKELFKSQT